MVLGRVARLVPEADVLQQQIPQHGVLGLDDVRVLPGAAVVPQPVGKGVVLGQHGEPALHRGCQRSAAASPRPQHDRQLLCPCSGRVLPRRGQLEPLVEPVLVDCRQVTSVGDAAADDAVDRVEGHALVAHDRGEPLVGPEHPAQQVELDECERGVAAGAVAIARRGGAAADVVHAAGLAGGLECRRVAECGAFRVEFLLEHHVHGREILSGAGAERERADVWHGWVAHADDA